MNSNQYSFKDLHAARAAVESADADIAKEESKAAKAARAVTDANRDDGSMPLETLLERIESAERTVKLRGLGLRRAEERREAAVASFHGLLRQSNGPLVAALRAKASKEKEKAREVILAQLGGVPLTGGILQTINSAESVTKPLGAAWRLESALRLEGDVDEPTEALIQNTFAAEDLL